MNSLGTACKSYVEKDRQELRIAIALSRTVAYQPKVPGGPCPQLDLLKANIKDTQLELISKCSRLYKFIDYAHKFKRWVPAPKSSQPPTYIVDALFFKMKADYMRYIYECLSGVNGLLAGSQETHNFLEEIESRLQFNISD